MVGSVPVSRSRAVPVHGQPGARGGRGLRGSHLHPQLPEPFWAGANVYLASAELAAGCRHHRQDPDRGRVSAVCQTLDATAADTYRYLNFSEIASYTKKADAVILQQAV